MSVEVVAASEAMVITMAIITPQQCRPSRFERSPECSVVHDKMTALPVMRIATAIPSGVREAVAMEITGHKTRSMYRRYRIVDERDLREATEKLQTHLESQDETKVIPLRANQ